MEFLKQKIGLLLYFYALRDIIDNITAGIMVNNLTVVNNRFWLHVYNKITTFYNFVF